MKSVTDGEYERNILFILICAGLVLIRKLYTESQPRMFAAKTDSASLSRLEMKNTRTLICSPYLSHKISMNNPAIKINKSLCGNFGEVLPVFCLYIDLSYLPVRC